MIAGAAHSRLGRRAALGLVLGGIAIAGMQAAQAESRLERGRYLMSSIVACGNCHTPKDSEGRPVATKELVQPQNIQWGTIMAAGTITTLPMMLLGLVIRKYLVTGLTMGAVKE